MAKADDVKPQQVFDRYEMVAITVPGAALVAVTWYLVGHPGSDNILKVTLGSLGVVVIAAFVAGHVVQSIANVVEDAWAVMIEAPALLLPSTLSLQRSRLETAIDELEFADHPATGGAKYDEMVRGATGKELRRVILSRIRAAKRSRMLDNLKITVAVSRGICVVAVIVVLVEFIRYRMQQPIDPRLLVAAIVVAIVSFARAVRYTYNFEREIWVQFVELSRPTITDGDGSQP